MSRKTIIKNCEGCGRIYTADNGSPKRRYCSRPCYYKSLFGKNNPFYGHKHTEEVRALLRQYRKKQTGSLDPSWKGGPGSYVCRQCGNVFRRHAGTPNYFCSRKCTDEHRSITQAGCLSSQWKGGVTPEALLRLRGKKWKEIRKRTLERDCYTCQKCGKKPGRLIAHHIVPFRYCFSDDENNLISLCSACHVHEENSLPIEHPEEYSLLEQWRAIVLNHPDLVIDKTLVFDPSALYPHLAPPAEQMGLFQ